MLNRRVGGSQEMRHKGLTPNLLQKGRRGKRGLRLRIESRRPAGDELIKDGIVRHTIRILQVLEDHHKSPKGEGLGLDLSSNASFKFSRVI